MSTWASVNAGVPQGFILGRLFFLISISDLSSNLLSTVKLFADDTSLYSAIHDINVSAKKMYLKKKINVSVYESSWHCCINPDSKKLYLVQEFIFSGKTEKTTHPLLSDPIWMLIRPGF